MSIPSMVQKLYKQAQANDPWSMRNMQPMFNEAYQRTSKAWGNEMAGTPGFLARGSMGSSPGALARLRARNTRAGTSMIADSQAAVAAENARSKRDYLIEKMRMKDQKKSQGGGGIGGFLGKAAGAVAGTVLSGGNPLAGVKSFLSPKKLPGMVSGGSSYGGSELSNYTPKPRVWEPNI